MPLLFNFFSLFPIKFNNRTASARFASFRLCIPVIDSPTKSSATVCGSITRSP